MPCRAPSSSRLRRPEKRGKNVGVSTIAPTRGITEASCVCVLAPSRVHEPLVGRTSPSRQRIAVVFPAPFGPRKPNTPPSATARSRPASAVFEPPRRRRDSLRRPWISMTLNPPPSLGGLTLVERGRRPVRGEGRGLQARPQRRLLQTVEAHRMGDLAEVLDNLGV